MSEAEARAEIVRYAALLWQRGLVAGNSGNLSVRLHDGTLLVTPTGMSLRALATEDVVRLEPGAVAANPGRRPTSELPLHVAAYDVRPDAACVIHTHPTYCVAWSKTKTLFPLDTVGALESLGSIAWAPYARSGTQELADICSRVFSRGIDTVVMERHGLSCVAQSLEDAFVRTDLAEQTAHIEYGAALLRAANVSGMTPRRIPLPIDELDLAAQGRPDARAALAAFHEEYGRERPDRARLDEHAASVRGYAGVAGPFERWWLDPRVQAFIAELGATGI